VSGLTGCGKRTLPRLIKYRMSPDLPYCQELPTPGPSQLHELIEELDVPELHTGVLLLERGASALIARAWLVQNATERIDAQYFIFAADTAGLVAIDALLLAADRGVKVRLLVDDTLAHGDPNVLHALSLHPNAEVRIYNPIINVGRTLPQKLNSVFGDFQQVNQRMHNKLFIADGRVAITGGRNMGSEYFDLKRNSNFRDRDVLLVEGAVDDAQESFEQFWSHSLAQPIEDLLDEPLRYPPEEVWERLHQFSCNPARFLPMLRNRVTAVPASLRDRVGQGLFHVAERVEYVSDDPGKNNSGTLTGGGVSTDALIALVRGAKESVVIQSPYLVTTALGLSVFKDAEDRGVQVRILTNSLASTDNILAFSGYRKGSDALLEAGVELYESKPRMAAQAELMNGPLRERFNSKMALHAKSMVVDGKISVVGSFNLDPRSANLNTESITVIHSKEVAAHLIARMETEMAPENAWQHTEDFTPDRRASIFRRLQVVLAKVVPVSLL
jgi:putative cardiolipin synthase